MITKEKYKIRNPNGGDFKLYVYRIFGLPIWWRTKGK